MSPGKSTIRRLLSWRPAKSSYLREALHFAGSWLRVERHYNERNAMMAIIAQLLRRNGSFPPERMETLKRLMAEDYPVQEIDRFIADLPRVTEQTPQEAAQFLIEKKEQERIRIIDSLLAMSLALGDATEDVELIQQFAISLNISDDCFKSHLAKLRQEEQSRKKIIRSGAGIGVALIVLLVFIATATLLRSVIFGLIVAYLLLPVEKYFENRLREKSGWSFRVAQFFGIFTRPLQKMSNSITRKQQDVMLSEDRIKKDHDRLIIKQAISQTMLFVILIFIAGFITLSFVTESYVKNLKERVIYFKTSPAAAENAPPITLLLRRCNNYLDRARLRFENLPLVKSALDQLENLLNDEELRNQLIQTVLRRSGGVFSFTAGIVGTVIAAVCDLLLTVFFGLLFLFKLAEFCRNDNSTMRQSEYLIRTVFNGHWLPGANEATIIEARRIIGGVIIRLQIWLKGYLSLVLIDTIFHTTVFFFLKVPYFWLFGILAGCGILLPYIGPILACSATMLAVLATGDAGGIQLAGVLFWFIFYNGIIEQFILYPAVIGESLGLTTLETIIVVLLGAIFAGIPGMIFALPAASMIKYLVPQIYYCFENRGNFKSNFQEF